MKFSLYVWFIVVGRSLELVGSLEDRCVLAVQVSRELAHQCLNHIDFGEPVLNTSVVCQPLKTPLCTLSTTSLQWKNTTQLSKLLQWEIILEVQSLVMGRNLKLASKYEIISTFP